MLEDQLKVTPTKLYGNQMKRVQCEKFLGDYFSEDGVSDSASTAFNHLLLWAANLEAA